MKRTPKNAEASYSRKKEAFREKTHIRERIAVYGKIARRFAVYGKI
jgi:hypothetical protein